jgi:hypothetical protein
MGGEGDIDLAIAALAARQHGRVSARQLRELGLGRHAISHRVKRRWYIEEHRGVYAVGHAQPSREARAMAAALAYGGRAVIGRRSAAALWQLRAASPGDVDVIVRSGAGYKPRKGIKLRRCTDLRDAEITELDGIPVTTVARTIFDCAAMLRPHELRRVVEQAELLGVFDGRALDAVLAGRRGRPGAPALTALLDDLRAHGMPVTRSALEAEFLEDCLARGLPRPLVNHRVVGYEVDFCWPHARLIVELNGFRYHRSRDAFERDHAKRLALERAGWRVVSCTPRLRGDAVARVAALLAAQ